MALNYDTSFNKYVDVCYESKHEENLTW